MPRVVAGVTGAISVGVILGLVIGKPLGLMLLSWLAVRSGLTSLPADLSWGAIFGVGWLAGIGFTMSLFVSGLAFKAGPALEQAKMGILVGSLVAGVTGYLVFGGRCPRIHRARARRHRSAPRSGYRPSCSSASRSGRRRDLDHALEGLVHGHDQEDRRRQREGAEQQRREHGPVEAREEAKPAEQDREPGRQDHQKGQRDGAALRCANMSQRIRPMSSAIRSASVRSERCASVCGDSDWIAS